MNPLAPRHLARENRCNAFFFPATSGLGAWLLSWDELRHDIPPCFARLSMKVIFSLRDRSAGPSFDVSFRSL